MDFIPSLPQITAMEKLALSLVPKAVPRKPAARKATKPLTPKGRKVLAYVKAHFGSGHWKGLGRILSVVLNDETLAAELDAKEDDNEEAAPSIPGFWDAESRVWTKGAAVIALKSDNGHDYDLDHVIIMAGDEEDAEGETHDGEDGFEMDRATGEFMCLNSLGYCKGEWRPATATEIREHFKLARKLVALRPGKDSDLPW